MTTETTDTPPQPDAVGAQVQRGVRPYATSVTWRNDDGGSWQQWHDDDDPLPGEWDERPPDEVVHVYTAAQVDLLVAAEREQVAKWVDAKLGGHSVLAAAIGAGQHWEP